MPSQARKSRFARHVAFLPLAVVLLTGCAVGPDYKTPSLSLPAHWGAEGDAAKQQTSVKAPELERWWTKLGDPALDQLIDEAVKGNLDVAAAKARIREARASYKQAGGALAPSVNGSGSFSRSKTASTGAVSNSFQAGFDASWEIDLFGANRRSLEAARYGLDAAQEDLRSTLLTLLGDVAQNYVQACGYRARIDLAVKTAASQRQTAALTQVKFESGGASAVDMESAAGQASTTEAQVQALETSYAETVHRLGVLLGREPAALYDRLSSCVALPSAPLSAPLGVPADMLRTRPDVRLAERQFAQATAKLGAADAALYPSISLTGNVATSGVNVGDLAKSSTISWSFGPTVSVPLFNAGQLEAAVEAAEAQRDQYFIAYRASVLGALEDVENTAVAFNREHLRNQQLASAAKSYRHATTLARALYEAGSTSFLQLLDSERTLYSAEDSLIQSNLSLATDYIALNKALGGGWDGAIDSTAPELTDNSLLPHF